MRHIKVSHKSSFRDPYSGRSAKLTRTLERNFASGGSVQPRVSIKVTDPDHARAQKESKRIAKDYGYARGGSVGYGDVKDSYLRGRAVLGRRHISQGSNGGINWASAEGSSLG